MSTLEPKAVTGGDVCHVREVPPGADIQIDPERAPFSARAKSLPVAANPYLNPVAEAHQTSIARRNGKWEFLETPELKSAKQEIRKLNGALDILSKPFPGHELLTRREHMALAQIVRGDSNKEAARILGVSPRTVEFHRANNSQERVQRTRLTYADGFLPDRFRKQCPCLRKE
jgi:DNA-binding CsgD family transcriptional regulator